MIRARTTLPPAPDRRGLRGVTVTPAATAGAHVAPAAVGTARAILVNMNTKQDTKQERGAAIAEITAEWYRNRARHGAKIADEIHDEKFQAILARGECR